MSKFTSGMEMDNNVRQYLATGNASWLDRLIPYPDRNAFKAILDTKSVRGMLPPALLSPAAPLVPEHQKTTGAEFTANGYPPLMPALDKPTLGSFNKSGIKSKSSVILVFNVPRGTDGVYLQVAGQPSASDIALRVEEHHGRERSIAPPIDPGYNWRTIAIPLQRNTTSFKIIAKDRSESSWLAFSMPVISNGHLPGYWARDAAAAWLPLLEAGIVLLAAGAGAIFGQPSAPVAEGY
jgi:hypothetical protein